MLEMIYGTSFYPYVSNERELSMRINHRLINSSRKPEGKRNDSSRKNFEKQLLLDTTQLRKHASNELVSKNSSVRGEEGRGYFDTFQGI